MAGPSENSAYTPWGPAQPYLTNIMGLGQGLYNSTAPNYQNPAPNFGFGQVTGALGSAINGTSPFGGFANSLAPGLGSAFGQQLSGQPDYTAVNGALRAANQQTMNQFVNSFIPQMNARASYMQNPTGAIKDTNWALSQMGQNMDLNAQQAYLGQYDAAQQRQANAMGLGSGLMQGAGAQSLQGASLFPSLSQMPFSNLANYANIVGNTGGRYGTQSTNINPGSFGTAANIIGGLTAGAGLYNQMFPSNGQGFGNAVLNGIGKVFGSNGSNPSAPMSGIGGYGSDGGYSNGVGNIDFSNLTPGQLFGGYPSNGFDSSAQPINANTTDFGNMSTSDLFGNTYQPSSYNNWNLGGSFTSAGGQAANPGMSSQTNSPWSTLGNVASGASNALGIASGLERGGISGYGSAGLNAAALANRTGLLGSNSGAVGSAAGYGANALGIYSGLKQGGVAGDTSAAVNAAQLGSRMGAFGGASGAIGTAAGYAAAPLAVYNAVNNWQSGATGSDALNGAEAGAAIGSVVPVVGTLAGGLIGGAIGALSSAFGPGEKDPENVNFEGMKNAYNANPNQQTINQIGDKYLPLAGLFDLRNGQIKGNIPIYNQYGRMGEQRFVTDMTGQINKALASGAISRSDNAQTIMNKVVNPWMNSFGKGAWTDTNSNAIKADIQGMVDDYINGRTGSWKAVGGDNPFTNLPAFGSPPSQTSMNLRNRFQFPMMFGAGMRLQ